MIEIALEQLRSTLERALLRAGVPAPEASICARVHSESTRDGVASHGVGRIPRLIEFIQRGWVDPRAKPSLVQALSTLEVYDAGFGLGVPNALFATERAMALAATHGLGTVALRDTSHWMRGGSYAWHAVERGFAAIMWTNTESVMPAWGAKDPCIGNNPLVMGVPRSNGPSLVLDMAQSQFSYGALDRAAAAGEQLSVDGGFDATGRPSRDPEAILATRRLLPAGHWKGSGLAILLDALGAMLAQGRPSHRIDSIKRGSGSGCCQVFMLFDPTHLGGRDACEAIADGIAAHIDASAALDPQRPPRTPGAGSRRDAGSTHVAVDESLWREVKRLAAGT